MELAQVLEYHLECSIVQGLIPKFRQQVVAVEALMESLHLVATCLLCAHLHLEAIMCSIPRLSTQLKTEQAIPIALLGRWWVLGLDLSSGSRQMSVRLLPLIDTLVAATIFSWVCRFVP
jgi:hypothetical protein